MSDNRKMHNPPHPGEFIKEVYLKPAGLSHRDLANSLKVASSTVNRLLNEKSGVSPEMAIRLSKALGRSAQSWLAMQNAYDLDRSQRKINTEEIERLTSSPK